MFQILTCIVTMAEPISVRTSNIPLRSRPKIIWAVAGLAVAGLELGARDLGSWLGGIRQGYRQYRHMLPTSNPAMWDVGFFPDFLAKKNKRIYKVRILKSDDLRLRSGNTNYAAAKKRRVWLVAGVRCSLCCVQFPILAINIDKLYGE